MPKERGVEDGSLEKGLEYDYFFKPPLSLLQSADNDDAEHSSRENLHSAEIKDAVLPDGIKRVSKEVVNGEISN
jgi:hypothetical protein